jgi:hypothetical protein
MLLSDMILRVELSREWDFFGNGSRDVFGLRRGFGGQGVGVGFCHAFGGIYRIAVLR